MNHVVWYGQWGLFDRQFGLFDSEEPDPDGRILQWDRASVQEMKDKLCRVSPCKRTKNDVIIHSTWIKTGWVVHIVPEFA